MSPHICFPLRYSGVDSEVSFEDQSIQAGLKFELEVSLYSFFMLCICDALLNKMKAVVRLCSYTVSKSLYSQFADTHQ